MKKFLNYLGEGVPAPFLHQIRRAQTAAEFHRICAEFLDHDEPMPLEPLDQSSAGKTWTPASSSPTSATQRTAPIGSGA